jgi:hypothetical protein
VQCGQIGVLGNPSRDTTLPAAVFNLRGAPEVAMVTTVGTESTPKDLVRNLLLLEHDAIAAYDQTIERLENPSFKEQIAAFKRDHDRHVDELRSLDSTVGVVPPTEGDAKQMLTTGKVALASLMGDKRSCGR